MVLFSAAIDARIQAMNAVIARSGTLEDDLKRQLHGAWIRDPQRIKPGAKMPALGLSEAQARAITTYLLSLK